MQRNNDNQERREHILKAGASHTGECFPAFFVLSKYSISTLSKFYFFINFLMKINSVFDINNNTD